MTEAERDAPVAERDHPITASPGAGHRDSPEAGAYSNAMIDRAISGEDSGVGRVLRDLLLRRVLVVATVAQLLDAFTTAAGLRLGLSERNPFTVSVLRAYGSAGLLLQKLLVVCLLLAAMAKLPRRVAVVSVCSVTLVTAVVVVANMTGLLTAR
jgi:uncharacterized protein DUF5658